MNAAADAVPSHDTPAFLANARVCVALAYFGAGMSGRNTCRDKG